jgi:hypothetical protein
LLLGSEENSALGAEYRAKHQRLQIYLLVEVCGNEKTGNRLALERFEILAPTANGQKTTLVRI